MVLLTQPLDTIKVNHQASVGGSPMKTAAAFLRSRGLLSMWSGLAPAMYAYVLEHAVLFAVQPGHMRARHAAPHHARAASRPRRAPPRLSRHVCSYLNIHARQ